VRWASVIAAGVVSVLVFQDPALGSWDEQDAANQPGARPNTAPVETQPTPGQAPATRPAQPGTRPAQPPATTPRTTQPRPPATSPTPAAPAAPAAQPGAPATAPGSEDLRAELERSLTSELGESPFAGAPGTFGSLAAASWGGVPQMIGDLGPLPRLSLVRTAAGGGGLPPPFPPPKPPGVPGFRGATLVSPSIRDVKISEDQSPRPQDRVYFTFNYFQGVNDQVNTRLQAPIGYSQVFRYIGGFEKTFLDGQGSIGIRAPLDSITANTASSRASGNFGGTSTAVGDMSIYGKYVLLENRETGSILSSGLAITLPTGPGRFAGFDTFAPSPHGTSFQPFIGYIYNTGRLYFHGFTIVDVTTTGSDPVLLYNDFGLGYFIRRPDPNALSTPLISMIAPTFEVHVTDPLNHRDPYSLRDPAGMTDIVNLTYGINIGIFERTLITFGVVTPVTSPKPFDFEAMAFINYFFGARRRPQLATPPVLGGF
jgi:hypothetical protein